MIRRRTVDVLAAVVAFVLTTGLAVSAGAQTPIAVEVSASSTDGRGRAHAAWRAFDADTNTAWCAAASDDAVGGSLTLRFAEPVEVHAIHAYGVLQLPDDGEEASRPQVVVTATSDAGAVTVSFDGSDLAELEIALPPGPTRSLTFHLAPRGPGRRERRDTCLSELHVELEGRAMVFGAPPEALTALPAAMATLDAAFGRCEPAELARLARFPVGFRQTSMAGARAYDRGPSTDTDANAYRRAADLPCAIATFGDEGDDGAHLVLEGSIAPGVVRVLAGAFTAAVYWELAWRSGRWQLVSLDTIVFE
jgi:hypothetical protein